MNFLYEKLKFTAPKAHTFPRGEGGRAKRGRKRNGDILDIGKGLLQPDHLSFPPAFLFSHRPRAATASPREKL